MGTNYYSIPKPKEFKAEKKKLLKYIEKSMKDIPFMEGAIDLIEDFKKKNIIHIGKRSYGWKFLWNFHNNEYFKDKETLIDFVTKRDVINEYGDRIKPKDFLNDAFEDGKEGYDMEEYYKTYPPTNSPFITRDKWVDGLRVCDRTEFS